METAWMMNMIWVAFGSALGGMARHALSTCVDRRHGERFPLGTLVVNVSGSLAIGWLASLSWAGLGPESAAASRLSLMHGLLGGYTTISSFSLQTLILAREGRLVAALTNVAISWGLCLGGVVTGTFLAG